MDRLFLSILSLHKWINKSMTVWCEIHLLCK